MREQKPEGSSRVGVKYTQIKGCSLRKKMARRQN
jgi:hypothetical protein